MRLQQYIIERARIVGKMDLPHNDSYITQGDLYHLERILDRLFNHLNIDIKFTKHFLDRVNDPRNKQQITFKELEQLYRKTYKKFGKHLSHLHSGSVGLLDDLQDDVNIPFVLQWDTRTKKIDLVAKTIMRKKNFKTYDKVYKV